MAMGDDVVLHWNPVHTFALDATQAADAGAQKIESTE
jgi:spermidine/putrescine transport system ATP-binding protein